MDNFEWSFYLSTKLVKCAECNEYYFRLRFKREKDLDESLGSNDGYVIQYPDGYISWCPKNVFEITNREVTNEEYKFILPSTEEISDEERQILNNLIVYPELKNELLMKINSNEFNRMGMGI